MKNKRKIFIMKKMVWWLMRERFVLFSCPCVCLFDDSKFIAASSCFRSITMSSFGKKKLAAKMKQQHGGNLRKIFNFFLLQRGDGGVHTRN